MKNGIKPSKEELRMKKLIKTEGTEFEQNLKDLAVIETTDRAGKPVERA